MSALVISSECDSCEAIIAINVDTPNVVSVLHGRTLIGTIAVDGDNLSWDCPHCGRPDGGSMEAVAMRMLG